MIDWNLLESKEQLHQALTSQLSAGEPVSSFYEFATYEKLECSKPVDGIIYCSIPVKSSIPLSRKKWLIKVHVLNGTQIGNIEVTEGYISL